MMLKNEIAELLNMMAVAYPNTKLKNPEYMLKAWEMAFGSDDAQKIYMAARFHMDHCKFFPTIADIREAIPKGDLVYGLPPEAPRKLIRGDVSEDAPCRLDRCILYHDLCNGLDEDGKCPFEGI